MSTLMKKNIIYFFTFPFVTVAQSAEAVEYTGCISAGG